MGFSRSRIRVTTWLAFATAMDRFVSLSLSAHQVDAFQGISNLPRDHQAHTTVESGKSRRDFLQQTVAGGTVLVAPWSMSAPVAALSPEEAATAYNSYASSYDDLDGGKASTLLGIDQARASLFSKASGKVLEIGAGTGLNLNKYNPSKLTSLTLLDISQGMLDQAKKRFQEDPNLGGSKWDNVSVSFVQADATSELVSSFGAGSMDTVVDSFSFCVMGTEGAAKCLRQMAQIVKPGTGRLLLLENARSDNPLLGKYQDATATAAASAGGKGCVYNQNVRAIIEATPGLKVEREEAFAAGLFRSFECSVQLL